MEDITDNYCNIKNSSYTTNVWQEWITGLPAGTYYVYGSGPTSLSKELSNAVHGEWYGEALQTIYAVKNNSQLFIINEDNYDSSTGLYTPVSSIPSDISGLSCDDLLDTPDYFIDQSKKVIDLFEGDIQIINLDYETGNTPVEIQGIKSTREMVVASGDINNGVAQTINSIIIDSSVSDNSTLKLALSIDSGETWLTYDGANWQPLSISIPKTEYGNLSSSELSSWNNARDTIFNNGIDTSTFNTLDFNTITETFIAPNTIRFAYVLDRPSYGDNVSTDKMTWNFNAKGNMELMVPGEYKVALYEHQIKFTSLIDNAMLITNVII